jgi:hypothetical protein
MLHEKDNVGLLSRIWNQSVYKRGGEHTAAQTIE